MSESAIDKEINAMAKDIANRLTAILAALPKDHPFQMGHEELRNDMMRMETAKRQADAQSS